MAAFGQFALAAAFVASAVGCMVAVLAAVRRTSGKPAFALLYATLAACIAASFALLAALLRHDFQIKYVAEYTDRALPTAYVIAAFWGGQSGSLLLWALLLAVFSVIAVRRLRRGLPEVALPAACLLLFIMCFFTALLVYVPHTDPFERSGLVPADGSGLNPLLRTVEMLFHPPMLYLGFVGSAIPFAIFLAGVWTDRLNAPLLRMVRRWTLFSWATLTAGIVLGAEWAYIELGWGGYWAWDPVENASLLPWFAMTAALHALILVRRRNMLRLTSFVLIWLTFALCVFGTLLTRSGIVASVHAFGKSPLLYCFIGLLAIAAVLLGHAVICRRNTLRSTVRMQSWLSRDGLFVLCVVALLIGGLVVFWGTMLPVFSQLVTGRQMTWDIARYNLATAPFAFVLLALLGACSIVAKQAADQTGKLAMRLCLPAGAGIVALFLAGALLPDAVHEGVPEILLNRYVPPVLIGLAAAAAAALIQALAGELRANRRLPSRTRIGALAVHAGIVLSLFGAAGSGYVRSREMTLKPGESATVGGYRVTFTRMDHREAEDGSYHEAKAILQFAKAGDEAGGGRVRPPRPPLTPAMIFYPGSERPHSEISVKSGLTHDLYAILSAYDEESASFKVLVYPLTIWLWIGGALMLAGGVAVMVPRKQPALAPAVEVGADPPPLRSHVSRPGQQAAVNFCPVCGARVIQAPANFCSNCGASFKEQHVEA